MSTIKTVSKKPSEQNNDDKSDFGVRLINELDLFVSKLTQDENHESLQKINEDITKNSLARIESPVKMGETIGEKL